MKAAREGAGLGLGLGSFVGLADAACLWLENPGSFPRGTVAPFLAASFALHASLGAVAGALVAAVAARAGAWRTSAALALGLGLALFAWAGVRVHVRWFFGEPLLSPANLLANAALGAGCFAIPWLLRRRLAGLADAATRGPVVGIVLVAVVLAGAAALRRPPQRSPGGSGGPAPPDAKDVLFVTLDTTRHDHLSAFGYPRGTTPAIDRIARRGASDLLWAPVPLTNPSHCSLLTGLAPRDHGVRNNGTALPDTLQTIVDALARDGWNCGAFVSGIPLKAGLAGLAGPFAIYDDAFSPLERVHAMMTSLAFVRVADRVLPGDLLERRADDTVAAAVRWLARTPPPRFLWVHLFDPHTPYRAAHPLGARFARESAAWSAAGRAATEWPIADYDAELRAADRALGRLFREFEAIAPDGVVAIGADHGEGLLQHGELTHGALLHEEDLRIGWVLAGAPGAEEAAARLCGERPPRPATDAATILLAASRGRRGPAPEEAPRTADTFPPEGRGRRTATIGVLPGGGIGKTIVDWESGERVAYRLDLDPGERRPIEPLGAEWVALLPAGPQATSRDALDPDVERRLRALGYVH